jgi:hypothetical protein
MSVNSRWPSLSETLGSVPKSALRGPARRYITRKRGVSPDAEVTRARPGANRLGEFAAPFGEGLR